MGRFCNESRAFLNQTRDTVPSSDDSKSQLLRPLSVCFDCDTEAYPDVAGVQSGAIEAIRFPPFSVR